MFQHFPRILKTTSYICTFNYVFAKNIGSTSPCELDFNVFHRRIDNCLSKFPAASSAVKTICAAGIWGEKVPASSPGGKTATKEKLLLQTWLAVSVGLTHVYISPLWFRTMSTSVTTFQAKRWKWEKLDLKGGKILLLVYWCGQKCWMRQRKKTMRLKRAAALGSKCIELTESVLFFRFDLCNLIRTKTIHVVRPAV